MRAQEYGQQNIFIDYSLRPLSKISINEKLFVSTFCVWYTTKLYPAPLADNHSLFCVRFSTKPQLSSSAPQWPGNRFLLSRSP